MLLLFPIFLIVTQVRPLYFSLIIFSQATILLLFLNDVRQRVYFIVIEISCHVVLASADKGKCSALYLSIL